MLIASLGCLPTIRSLATQAPDASAELDRLGSFEVVLGRPGVVIGVPHGTPDAGTLEAGRLLCEKLGVGGVFVTGFWDPKTRQRINVNRPTEQLIGANSEVLRQWRSDRAIALNLRYEERVREVAQGPLKAFYEIHSNHRPQYAGSIEVSTLGVTRGEAARFKAAFEAARDQLARDMPRVAVHVSPIDRVTYPNYRAASSISGLSQKGCAIEHPGHVYANRAWRHAYADCLAEAIGTAHW
ncbi:MAG TPA: hypothetical protein VMG60_23865 [Burkholderiaceae bacterium]|nr:hypothetical protein [Burkholderiaceae bacterium]